MAAKKDQELEIRIVSPTPRYVSEEEALFWLNLMPPELLALIDSLYEDENQ